MLTERVRQCDDQVAHVISDLYRSYGSPEQFDSFLHSDVTIWESDQPHGLLGLEDLDRLRGTRSGGDDERPSLSVEEILVDRWGDRVAVARYVLRASTSDSDTAFRVTDVLEMTERRWRIVHHHAEQLIDA